MYRCVCLCVSVEVFRHHVNKGALSVTHNNIMIASNLYLYLSNLKQTDRDSVVH